MRKYSFLFFLALLFMSAQILSQPAIQWQKCLGGNSIDNAYSIQPTSDGGYIIAGSTNSNNGDVSGHHTGFFGRLYETNISFPIPTPTHDYWVVKLNGDGNIQWQKCLGGSSDDFARSVKPTVDGGYIVAGYSFSNDGDVSGNHGGFDYWVVKLDNGGNIQWQKCLGGSANDYAYSIQPTSDGGFIVAGNSFSNNADVSGNHGGNDCWIVKLNNTGDILWQRSLGGSKEDFAKAIEQTADGGYIFTGHTLSNDGDISGHHGNPRQVNYDYWVVKLNSTGSIQWQKCLGGKLDDLSFSIQQTGDGGYVVAGFSLSTDEDVAGHHKGNKGQVNADYWIVKLNPAGAIQWQKCLGGKLDDKAHSVRQTADGGYVVAGYSLSNDGDVSGNHGRQDYWIVQLDAGSNIQWQKSLGGSLDDFCYSVLQKNDDGYVAVGSTNSNNGDVSGNHGNVDYWVISLDGAGSNSSVQRKSMTVKEADPISFTFYPNPARENITIRSSGATIPGDLMLLLFNAAGQKIKEISIQSSNTSVSLSGLAGGLYIYQVTNRRQILQTGRIIVEKGSKTPSFNQTNIKTSY